MAQFPPHRRPYYPPTERFAILQLKAARGWSQEQTAQRFLVTTYTYNALRRETAENWLNGGGNIIATTTTIAAIERCLDATTGQPKRETQERSN